MSKPVDALTSVLQTAGLCFAIVVAASVLGPTIDAYTEERIAVCTSQTKAIRLQALRDGFEHGLEEGRDRALFEQQRWLADREHLEPELIADSAAPKAP